MCRFLKTVCLLICCVTQGLSADTSLHGRSNLVAWCIVPFDAQKRNPEQRAEMLNRLGIKRLAYDWRDEHIPTFDEEVLAMKRHGIEITAWWSPGTLNDTSRKILEVLERHGLKSQLWVLISEPLPGNSDQRAKVRAAATELRPLAEEALKIGCKVGLYNHGGWFGEPENQLAIIEELNLPNVGIVYNFHHGHDHIERFGEMFRRMQPHLLALNLNGMVKEGDQHGHKILHLGEGDQELGMIQTVLASGWKGPIGILDHRPETDSEQTLRKNLRGLDYLVKEIENPGSGGERPFPVPVIRPQAVVRSSKGGLEILPDTFGTALSTGRLSEGTVNIIEPFTVECWAQLRSRNGFNILVASEPKSDPAHWEIYTYAGTGELSAFLPGRGGEYKTGVNVCDGKWHHLAMTLGSSSIRLFVGGELVKESDLPPAPDQGGASQLAFGRLVEGGIGCDGSIDDVHLTKGARMFEGQPKAPAARTDETLGLWNFDEERSSTRSSEDEFWAVEDPAERAKLPDYKTIPAASPKELTRTTPETAATLGAGPNWERSHGDNGGTRFSRLDQITRDNVAQLEVAWTYRSGDGVGNIQANPVIVDGIIYAPTVGHYIVAIDGRNGKELWRFKPEGRPAHRGLIYSPGENGREPRLIFPAGSWLYALNPRTGEPIAGFGENGRLRSGSSVVAPAIYKNIIIVPGYDKDVFAFDLENGNPLWTFHTIPEPGEFGYDTWDQPSVGANCWGGMVLDEERGIAFVSTGSPKPNFTGMHHRGDNLFSNCVIAIDANTGKRLWHFQEIRHDIWDLDLAAPPNLITVNRNGVQVDAVAQVTKLGNTLLLDRVTGKPLFPFRLRRAPVSKLPGERTAPYQPDVELPRPFAKQIFTMDQVTDRTEDAREFVLNQVQRANYGWFEPFEEGKPTALRGFHGGAEWTGAAVDPLAGRLYVSANEVPWIVTVFRTDEVPRDPNAPPTKGETIYQAACATCHGANREGVGVAPPLQGLRHRLDDQQVTELLVNGRNTMPAAPPMSREDQQALLDFIFLRDRENGKAPADAPPNYTHNGYPKLLDHEGYPGTKPPWGTLNCLDLNTGELLWQVLLGEHEELTREGFPKTGTENFGGPIATAGGLVFCAGTRDEKIRAFDSTTGAELWSHKLPWGGYAPPASYEVDGRQYVLISATGGGKLGGPMGDAYVAFALPDTALGLR